MLNNLQTQDVVACMTLAEAQALFEAEVEAGTLSDDFDLSEAMYFKRKNSAGAYMSATTLAVFVMFCKGLDAGFNKAKEV